VHDAILRSRSSLVLNLTPLTCVLLVHVALTRYLGPVSV
jgi:hypothetical protein